MASYTTNLNLKKPAGSEAVAIGDINNNMDTIDQAYGTLSNQIANVPSIITGTFEAKTIAIGTQVITYNVPANMPDKTAKLIVAYSAYDNLYFQWNPQNWNLQNAGCWSFNVRNDRNNAPTATVLFVVFY